MYLKKYAYLLLAGALATFNVACDDDDETEPDVPDTQAPTATLTSPTEAQLTEGFMPGGSLMVAGTVADNEDLNTVTLTIEDPDGTAWYNESWADADFTDQMLTLNETITIPAGAAEGTHVMTLTAEDAAENPFTQSWNIIVEEEDVDPDPENMVTFTIEIPEPVEEDIYIAGELALADTSAAWTEPGTVEAFKMTKVDDTHYTITVQIMNDHDPANTAQYKFFLGTGWGGGEVNADCTNREGDRFLTLPLEVDEVTDIVIGNWEGACEPPPPPPATTVTFTIEIPEPVEEDIYIAGELALADTSAAWTEPGSVEAFKMTKVDDTHYTITVQIMNNHDPANTAQYKFFLGTGWEGGEVNADCTSREGDRFLELPLEVDEVTDIVIGNWESVCAGG